MNLKNYFQIFMCTLFLWSSLHAASATSPPEEKTEEVSQGIKIKSQDGNHLIVFPDGSLWLLRNEDKETFRAWIDMYGQNLDQVSFSASPTGNPENPYKIIAKESRDEFFLERPESSNKWFLLLEKWRRQHVAQVSEKLIQLVSDLPTDSNMDKNPEVIWEANNPEESTPIIETWQPSDPVVIARVMAYSIQQDAGSMVGYLMFRFESEEQLNEWLNDFSNPPPINGIWVHPVPQDNPDKPDNQNNAKP